MITDRRKFTAKITIDRICSFHIYSWNQFKVIPSPVHYVQETAPNLLRRPTWVDNTADNAGMTQSKAANHNRLLSHVTLGLVERMK